MIFIQLSVIHPKNLMKSSKLRILIVTNNCRSCSFPWCTQFHPFVYQIFPLPEKHKILSPLISLTIASHWNLNLMLNLVKEKYVEQEKDNRKTSHNFESGSLFLDFLGNQTENKVFLSPNLTSCLTSLRTSFDGCFRNRFTCRPMSVS